MRQMQTMNAAGIALSVHGILYGILACDCFAENGYDES